MKKLILIAACLLTTTVATAQDLISVKREPNLYCLAQNIYYEARGSSRADQMAVSDVVLNRVKDSRYPNTICDVVYQGKQRPSWKDPTKMVMVRNMCQFSWYCDGKKDEPPEGDPWRNAPKWLHMKCIISYKDSNIHRWSNPSSCVHVSPRMG